MFAETAEEAASKAAFRGSSRPASESPGQALATQSVIRGLLLTFLLLLLFRHVMADRTTAGRAQHAVVRHVSGHTADNGALDAALGIGLAGRAGRECECERGRYDQYLHSSDSGLG